MGLILFFVMAAGCAAGLIVTALLGGLGVVITIKGAEKRVGAWRYFTPVFLVLLLLLIALIYSYPYAPAAPGSDYGILMKNLFVQGLCYCASPGIAAFLAALAALFLARTPIRGQSEP